MSFSPEDLARHKRHIMLKEIGGPGVQKLRAASISIVGAGALGGPCAMFLAAAGIGQIEIWDDDVIERSNLQRQIQFGERDLGKAKVDILAERLATDHPGTRISTRRKKWSPSDPLSGSILVDATDNFRASQRVCVRLPGRRAMLSLLGARNAAECGGLR